MKNVILGIIILFLYFGNYYISMFIANNDNDLFWDIKPGIYSLIIILALKYKESGNFIEKLFVSIIINDVYVVIVKNEITYSLNDLWFVAIFTVAQYIKVNNKKNE